MGVGGCTAMPYDPTDPRAQMTPSTSTTIGLPRPAQYRELHAAPPDEQHPHGSVTWWTRSQSVVVGFTEARSGEELAPPGDVGGEYVVLVLDGAQLQVAHESGAASVTEPSVVFVPAGSSTITVAAAGTIVRLFATPSAPELAARCANAGEYAEPDLNVTSFAEWPEPPSGHRIRVYPLSRFPLEDGLLGRIFRCSTLMVNVLPEDDAPRDPAKLSPHHHDDFEQISLQIRGDYVHHMRTPWTPDRSTWRDDEHRHCTAPAVVVIPPMLIHTSQSVNEMQHWLIDVFAPPRLDFSSRPGWVRNADDYPMPTAPQSA